MSTIVRDADDHSGFELGSLSPILTAVSAGGTTVDAATGATLAFAAGQDAATPFSLLLADSSAASLEEATVAAAPLAQATRAETATAVPQVSVADMVVSEGDGYVDVVVTLDVAGTLPVTVTYTTTQATAYATYDYGTVSGTLTFEAGQISKTVRVTLESSNSYDDGDLEHFRFDLTNASNGTLGKSSGMITIIDNDNAVTGVPQLYVRDVVVDEKAGTATFVVLLGGVHGQATGNTVTVDYTTVGGSAASGTDFDAVSGTLTFNPGQTVKNIVVDLNDDTTPEGIERFTLNLSNAANATIVDGSATANLGASDRASVVGPTLSVADMTVSEGDGYIDVVVTLSAPSSQVVSVNYASTQGTAYNTYDYINVAGTLNFAVGETTKTVRIELNGSGSYDDGGLEHFRFDLASPTNASLGKGSAMITLIDNDNVVVGAPQLYVHDVVTDEKSGTATFVVTLGNVDGQASANVITVDYSTGSNTAVAGSDFATKTGTLIFGPGETVKTVVVDLNDDLAAEAAERFYLSLSNPTNAVVVQGRGTATIGANDAGSIIGPTISVADKVVSEGDGYVDVVVTLSAPSTQAVSVNYGTVQGTAYNGYDYVNTTGTLNFAIGETTKTVRVELGDTGTYDDGSLEHFRFDLASPTNASLGKGSAMISVVDNDTVVVGAPQLYVRNLVTDEKAGTATFVVTLGNVNGQASNSVVTVDYTTGSDTATAGTDFATRTGTLVFGPGETVKTVVVDLNNDTTAEIAERFNLTLSNATNASIVQGRGTATIGASDGASVVGPTLSVADTIVSEGDGYVDVIVTLSAPSTQYVSVNYASAQGSSYDSNYDFNGVSGTLNFAAGETTKTIRIELGESDSYDTGSIEHFRLNLSGATNATVSKASAMVLIVDNDNAVVGAPGLWVGDTIVDEKAGTASFVVTLGGAYGQASNSVVTVNYATSTGSALSGTDFAGRAGTLVFGPGESVKTVVIDLKDDTTAEGLERINMTLSNPTNASIVDAHGVAVIGNSDGTSVVGPTITVADKLVSESDGYVDLVVRLSAPSSQPVTVAYATQNATAYDGNYDYNAVSGTLNFAAGETTKVVRVQLGDTASYDTAGLSEQFRLNLSAPTNAVLGNTTATVTIVDDDLAGTNVYSLGISDDVYTVVAASDLIVENAGGGTDLVRSSVNFTLGDEVENLTLTGAAGLTGTGNTKDNVITGNASDNTLYGLTGNDSLDGAGGNDLMYGGSGNDTYVVTQSGDTVFETSASGGTDTVRSSRSHSLGLYVENLTLTGAAVINGTGNGLNNAIIGNGANNVLTGGGGNDTLNGAAGNDTLVGGTGNDTYVIDSTGDTITELTGVAYGIDTVLVNRSFVLGTNLENLTLTGTLAINGTGNSQANRLIGNSAVNVLTGGSGNDTLDGGGGADSLVGGTGNDTYVIDSTGDTITEVAGAAGGVDTVQTSRSTTLSVDLENLTLLGSSSINGTGNAGNNLLLGNSGTNALTGGAGNDTLNGGTGADAMAGGTGNDLYVVENAGDVVTEALNAGIDTVQSSRSFVLGNHVDNLLLTGTATIGNGNSLNNVITGNASSNSLNGGTGNDTLVGAAGNDSLNGGTGADSMSGGLGSDVYYVDNLGDRVTDVSGTGSGSDKVFSVVNFSLATAANVENLTLTGTNVNGTGNTLANKIVGSSGANVLNGGAGNDTLTGGTGADTFVFSSLSGRDAITDFSHALDTFRFSQGTITIGDGDNVVDGGATRAVPSGFSKASEVVIFTSDIFGDINTTSAAAQIGNAASAYAVNDQRIFVVDNGSQTGIYLFHSSTANANVSASELTLIALVDMVDGQPTTLTDYTFAP